MITKHLTLNNIDELRQTAEEELAAFQKQGHIPVLIVPSFSAQVQTCQALAQSSCALGVRVTTLADWIADQWELFGSGTTLIDSTQRTLLMQQACQSYAKTHTTLNPTTGATALLTQLAHQALPLLLNVQASTSSKQYDALNITEHAMIEVLAIYAQLLDQHALLEPSQAAEHLASSLNSIPPFVVTEFNRLAAFEQHFVKAIAKHTSVTLLDDSCTAPSNNNIREPELQQLLTQLYKPTAGKEINPQGAVEILLPAGRYATPHLVGTCAVKAVLQEKAFAEKHGTSALPVVICARNPRKSYDKLALPLARKGISCALSTRRTFPETSFGQAFLALTSLLRSTTLHTSHASDFASNIFSGLSQQRAQTLDSKWQGWRAITNANILEDLSSSTDFLAAVIDALRQRNYATVFTLFEQHIHRLAALDESFRAEQLLAITTARSFFEACDHLSIDPLTANDLLQRISIKSTVHTLEYQAPTILFLSLEETSELSSNSCSTLIMCDMESSSYPVLLTENNATLLLEKLELYTPIDALSYARQQFFRALSSARSHVVMQRVLNDEDAGESYPAVMFEELIDCYRDSSDLDEAIDPQTKLPLSLASFAQTASEANLEENALLSLEEDAEKSASSPLCNNNLSRLLAKTGELSEQLRGLVAPEQQIIRDDATSPSGVLLSASAIERYLECPYKWFAERRLRLAELGASFGPLEKGSFAHLVLKEFYETFSQTDFSKVSSENLTEARNLMRKTAAKLAEQQTSLDANQNPLIALTKLEEIELSQLENSLVNYLDYEAQLLQDYIPTHFELSFGHDKPVGYAGCYLRGCIDRIDINSKGQAVIIDYKGSLKKSNFKLDTILPTAQANNALLPPNVQTLIYAQIVQKILGVKVVGALYISYKPTSATGVRIAGFYDRNVLSPIQLPNIEVDASGLPGPAAVALEASNFEELLDETELRIAQAIAQLKQGYINPLPRSEQACTYCPVLSCEKRL